jgi:hypothetical protein
MLGVAMKVVGRASTWGIALGVTAMALAFAFAGKAQAQREGWAPVKPKPQANQQRDDRGVPRGNRNPLKVGDAAPDFTLETVDHENEITLSSFHGDRPVVLLFGSYT